MMLMMLLLAAFIQTGSTLQAAPGRRRSVLARAQPQRQVDTVVHDDEEFLARRRDAVVLNADSLVRTCPWLGAQLARCRQSDLTELQGYADELTRCTEYLRPSGQLLVRKGLEMAFLAHLGQLRRSGEPYITHPVAVAVILAGTEMDRDTVIAGLLHDTIEDTELSFAAVEAEFGAVVRKIVEGETKVSKLPKIARDERERSAAKCGESPEEEKLRQDDDEQLENMRSLFISMAEDWRIVVVKLADRLHNMRTLQYMSPSKRISISRETMEIFAPLAHRLGMWQYKTELEETSFMYLFPTEWNELFTLIQSKRAACEDTLQTAKTQLEALLNGDEWLHERIRTIQIEGRTKSTFSTWKKMQRHGVEFERIDDLIAVRVVLRAEEEDNQIDDIALCYHVLGKVHGCWTPLPRTLKDYISQPKPNGYRSLHTTVLVGSQPLEIQIRTEKMHRVAELGAAAHWAYKDSSASLPWLAIIREWHAQVDSSSVFMHLVRRELLGTRVFVFAPQGRILNLAKGATLKEAQAQIMSDDDVQTPAVNGVETDSDYELTNGDIVSFVVEGQTRPRSLDDDWSTSKAIVKKKPCASEPAWSLCQGCLPLPGDAVIGCSGLGYNHVHRSDVGCVPLRRELERPGSSLVDRDVAFLAALQPGNAISDVDGVSVGFKSSFVVFCHDRPKMLLDISLAVSAVNIVDVMSETLAPRGQAAFQYTVHVENLKELDDLQIDIKNVPGITTIVRGTMKLLKQSGDAAFWRLGHEPTAVANKI